MDITQTELEVMQVIWQMSPLTADEIVCRLNESKKWHEKTVKTLLNRLTKKGVLKFNRIGRQYEYYPTISQRSYQEKETQSFITRIFQGRIPPLVAGFVRQEKLSNEDIAELKKLISDWEQEND